MAQIKWYNITEWFDIETGEQLRKEQIKNKDYRIISSEESTEKKNMGTSYTMSERTEDSANDTNKQESTFEMKGIESTPFVLVSQNGQHFGVIGNKRITEIKDTAEEVIKDLSEFNWNVLAAFMEEFIERREELKKLEEND